ncbi:cysteine synthase family protein [Candidatus Kuenenbacteria bacterium]|nr:cysteine synthase family protein [Candidatus Kuenenbacteria bacterium]
MKYQNILQTIGNTPVVKINRLNPNNKVNIFVKLEGQNSGGSVKDRPAEFMIEQAEKTGELTSDKIILEATSGNTGIGLALVAAVKGYKTKIVMSAGASKERKQILKLLGADIIETPAKLGTDGSIKKVRQMFEENPKLYWVPNQFDNQNNTKVHFVETAKEIIEQVPEITAFVAGIGTSGTLMGVSKKLKKYNHKIQIVGIESDYDKGVPGLKNLQKSIVPKIYNQTQIDKNIVVNVEHAYRTVKLLARKEGILAGLSSGAAMYVALQIAKQIDSGNIVVLFPDRIERYLSLDIFEER